MVILSFPLAGTFMNVPESHLESLCRVLKVGAIFVTLLVDVGSWDPLLCVATLLAFRLPENFAALVSVSPSVN